MGSILSYAASDLFIFRTVKYHASNPDDKWANSYEFHADTDGTITDLLTLGNVLVNFEAQLHLDNTRFDHLLLSTWEPDSKPYDPQTFASIPLTQSGLVGGASDRLSVNQCLVITRVPTSGRFGHLFYRNALSEEDVNAPAGKLTLVTRTGKQTLLDTALTTSNFEDYIGSTTSAGLTLVMITKDASVIRDVNALVVSGVTSLPTDHAWFNRKKTPSPP